MPGTHQVWDMWSLCSVDGGAFHVIVARRDVPLPQQRMIPAKLASALQWHNQVLLLQTHIANNEQCDVHRVRRDPRPGGFDR